MLFVGVDARRSSSGITVMDEASRILRRQQVCSSPKGFQKALGHYRQPLRAVVEASYSWGLVYDWLEDLIEEVILAHPAKVRAIAESRIKTDKIDSETLAHLLRANLIPRAYAPPKETRALNRVLRQRLFLVRLRTSVKNPIRALLAQHAVELPALKHLFGKVGLTWLEGVSLPGSDGPLLSEHLELLRFVQIRVEATEELIAQLSQHDPAVRWLSNLPGLGRFLAVLIRWEADDIGRFPSAKRFASYTDLVPLTYASGHRVVHGRLAKQGNRWLRWAFIEAVTAAVRGSSHVAGFYQRIETRRGAKDARSATARKLAELVWTIWTQQRCYV